MCITLPKERERECVCVCVANDMPWENANMQRQPVRWTALYGTTESQEGIVTESVQEALKLVGHRHSQ